MTNKEKFNGIVVPAVTPLTKDFKIDQGALERMFTYFHQYKVMPFINGTTGESASLPFKLKQDYVLTACKLKYTGDKLYVGISANCVEETVKLANIAFDCGADAVAATLPSYYNLSEYQILTYFEQLAIHVSGPIIIYNIPSTTRMSIPLELIDKLSYNERFIGTKDSERNEDRLKQSLELWRQRPDFCHFLGWAPKSAEALINGSDGLIPSTGNINPQIYAEMLIAVKNGDHNKAYSLQRISDQLGDVYQKGKLLGESLWALKVCMHELGICDEYVMPPLYPMPEEERSKVINTFKSVNESTNLPVKSDANV